MTRIIALALSLFLFSISVQAEEVKIKSANLTLNANLNIASGKKLSDGVVLMLHGTLAHKDMEVMRALQDMLMERGINNLAINLSLAQDNRYGMYDCASPHRHSDTDAIKEIGLWVKWLKSKGAVKITALGHSRGGNQMSRFAAANSDPVVKAVVLVAPPTLSPGQPASGYKKNYKKDLAPLLVRAQSLVKAGKGGQVMEGVDFLYCPSTKVTAATFAEYYGHTPDRDTPSVVKRIKIPVLAVAGGNDRLNSKFAARMKAAPQANVKLVVVDDAGHFFRDLYGEDLADVVQEFVAAKIN